MGTWVVLVTEVDGDTVTCQAVAEFETRQEADNFACEVASNNASFLVEVCTPEQAAAVVTD